MVADLRGMVVVDVVQVRAVEAEVMGVCCGAVEAGANGEGRGGM